MRILFTGAHDHNVPIFLLRVLLGEFKPSPSMPQKSDSRSSRSDAGVLIRPRNLLKTAASFIPVAAALAEALGQIEAEQVDQRVGDLESWRKLHDLEAANPPPPPAPLDWPTAVADFHVRTVDLCVFYDGSFEHPSKRGRELFLHVCHGCLVDGAHIVTTTQALDMARAVAEDRRGRVVLVVGMSHFELDVGSVQDHVSLSVCPIGRRDTANDEKLARCWRAEGVEPPQVILPTKRVTHTLTPWLGTEVGFLHAGEAEDAIRPDRMTRIQFDASVISHFRGPSQQVLKAAVTGVIGSRFKYIGSPVFTRSGVLVGCLAESENYESDAGRRAVIYGLLGHPFFTPSMRKETK